MSNNNFRPYVGLRFGLFCMAAVSIDDGGSSVEVAESANEFGVYSRIGFDAGHFTFNIDYNILPRTKGLEDTEFKNSFIGFHHWWILLRRKKPNRKLDHI